ncbi:hypothetical protein OQA88_5473 [Cercophora sp. LCS_1]
MFAFFVPMASIEYPRAYLNTLDDWEACFYMPCSPQSISDMDQSGTLFIGLVLFVGIEVVVPVYRKFKKMRTDNKIFMDTVDGRITAGVMARAALHGNSGIEIDGAPVHAVGRMNSGIELEEGLVSISRRGTGTARLSEAVNGPFRGCLAIEGIK